MLAICIIGIIVMINTISTAAVEVSNFDSLVPAIFAIIGFYAVFGMCLFSIICESIAQCCCNCCSIFYIVIMILDCIGFIAKFADEDEYIQSYIGITLCLYYYYYYRTKYASTACDTATASTPVCYTAGLNYITNVIGNLPAVFGVCLVVGIIFIVLMWIYAKKTDISRRKLNTYSYAVPANVPSAPVYNANQPVYQGQPAVYAMPAQNMPGQPMSAQPVPTQQSMYAMQQQNQQGVYIPPAL
ncbi:hypothetical protein WA158_004684 [Blastocystis sp. Blastoise]